MAANPLFWSMFRIWFYKWMALTTLVIALFCARSVSAQTSELTVEVNWVSWASDNKVEVYDPNGNLIFEVCEPGNCQTTATNSSYSSTFNLGCYANLNNYYVIALDAYGDGWNGSGNYVRVNSGGAQVLNYDLTSGSTSGQQFFNVSGGGTCPTNDAGIDAISYPANGCGLSNSETISITLRNQGTTTITTCPIEYSLDGTNYFSAGAYSGSLAAGNTDTYNFNIDLSSEGAYSLSVRAQLVGDGNTANDEIADYAIYNALPHDLSADGDFTMGFEASEESGGWATLNVNGDGGVWALDNTDNPNNGTQSARYNYNTTNAANDWMFSPCITLEAGSTYELTYSYRVQNAGYPESFSVLVTSAQDNASTVSTIETLSNLTNTTYTQSQNTFTVTSTGTYYIAWQATSAADQWNIFIDDVSLSLNALTDAAITAITPPADDCSLSAAETVQVTIENVGSLPISNIPVEYRVDGGSYQSGGSHAGIIAAGATASHSFTVDLSGPGTHTIDARTQLSGDEVSGNDEFTGASATNESLNLQEQVLSMGFEDSEDYSSWLSVNNNADTRTWELTTGNNPNNGARSTRIRQTNSAADDWLFTQCASYEAAENYVLEFYYRVRNGSFQESMEVRLCTAQTVASSISTLSTYSNFSNTAYQQSVVPFNVPADGSYYLAFRATSAASQRGIHLDDILIYGETDRWLGYSTTWDDANNWSNGIPTASSIVYVPNAPVGGNHPAVSGNGSCDDLTIDSGASLSLGTSATLSVNGDVSGSFDLTQGQITMDGGAAQSISGSCTFYDLSIDNTNGVSLTSGDMSIRGTLDLSDGQLDLNGNSLTIISDASGDARIGPVASGSVNGNVTVQRYIDAGETNWRFMCSPVQGADFEQWDDDFITSGFIGSDFPNFYFTSIYSYDETVAGDQDLGFEALVNSTQPITVGEGFWVWCGDNSSGTAPFTVDVTGPINTGAVNLNVSYSNSGSAVDDGWTMVGNPYACEINWDTTGWTKTNINNAIYIWDPDEAQYASYVGGVGVNGGTRYIASGQAFWVQANGSSPQLTATEAVKSSSSTGFLKPSPALLYPQLRMTLSSAVSHDEMLLRFMDDGQAGFQPEMDAQKLYNLENNIPNIASLSAEGDAEAINTQAALTQDISIPIEMKVLNSGTYEVEVNALQNFDPTSCLLLEDLETGDLFDLRVVKSFSRALESNTTEPRFLLHVTAPLQKEQTDVSCHGEADGQVALTIASKASWNFYLRDDQQQLIDSAEQILGSGRVVFSDLVPGLYYVGITSDGQCPSVRDTFRIQEPERVVSSFQVNQALHVHPGVPVSFSNESGGATDYQWNFGDGTQSDFSDPVHTYNVEGTYGVTLVARNDKGCEAKSSKVVVVTEALGIATAAQQDQITVFGDGRSYQVAFNFDQPTDLNVRLLDNLGRTVMDLGSFTASQQTIELQLDGVSSGMYILDLSGEGVAETHSIIVR